MMQRIFCVLLLVLLTACGAPAAASSLSVVAVPSVAPAPTNVASVPSPASPAAASTVVAGTANDALVVYHRSGGITGQTTVYTILRDGSVVVGSPQHTRPGTAPVGDQRVLEAPSGAIPVETLVAQIAATHIDQLAGGDYAPVEACCDRYSYEITLLLDGQHVTYSTVSGANNPAELAAVLDLVQQYLEAIEL